MTAQGSPGRDGRLRRYWDKHAGSYDSQMAFFDRRLFGDSRDWVCSRASGDVLEVAIGTGLNLAHYPDGARLTGVEWSPAMLDIARGRARDIGRTVDLRLGDAQALAFPDASFDAVVCTFSLCAIPDDGQAVREMVRVLRPDGLLLLVDHVEAARWPVRAVQRMIEVVSVPVGGEHFRRRPIRQVQQLGLPQAGDGTRLNGAGSTGAGRTVLAQVDQTGVSDPHPLLLW
jgi:ubiquinone/menaquinone biosynthesis C-methylase UbiE